MPADDHRIVDQWVRHPRPDGAWVVVLIMLAGALVAVRPMPETHDAPFELTAS